MHDPREDDPLEPLTEAEREDVLEDLADLELSRRCSSRRRRGLVIDCEDCHEPHYFDWDLLRSNLRHLLDSGRPRLHEPAYDPDPEHYVSWDYARGYADGVHDTLTEGTEYEVPARSDRAGRVRRLTDQAGPEARGYGVGPVAGA